MCYCCALTNTTREDIVKRSCRNGGADMSRTDCQQPLVTVTLK